MDAAVRRVFEQGLGDAEVVSISWVNDDLLFDFLLPGDPTEYLGLRFTAIARLRIGIDFGDYVGKPLLFSAELQEVKTWWKVIFKFGAAPEGSIEFECNDVSERAPQNFDEKKGV
jgi:hypothetical protein